MCPERTVANSSQLSQLSSLTRLTSILHFRFLSILSVIFLIHLTPRALNRLTLWQQLHTMKRELYFLILLPLHKYHATSSVFLFVSFFFFSLFFPLLFSDLYLRHIFVFTYFIFSLILASFLFPLLLLFHFAMHNLLLSSVSFFFIIIYPTSNLGSPTPLPVPFLLHVLTVFRFLFLVILPQLSYFSLVHLIKPPNAFRFPPQLLSLPTIGQASLCSLGPAPPTLCTVI